MKKIAILLLLFLGISTFTVYSQECSERIQAAGRIYEKYKKTYDKKLFDEARKQLVNIKNTKGAPESCKKEADRLLKTWKPVYKTKPKTNVDVKPIVVRTDTIIEHHINIDTVVSVLVHQDSFKLKRFYETESAAMDCSNKKDYDCAVNNYRTAIAFGRDLNFGEGIIALLQDRELNNTKLQFNTLLAQAKQSEDEGKAHEALRQYELARTYGVDNHILDSLQLLSLSEKAEYLQNVEMMFEFVDQAEEYFHASEWELAKNELQLALDISDTLGWKKGVIHWVHKMDTIDHILALGSDTVDYVTLNKTAYEEAEEQVMGFLHNAMLRFNEIPADTAEVVLVVSPMGDTYPTVTKHQVDTLFSTAVMDEFKKARFRLPAVSSYGQPVTAVATYRFTIEASSAISKVNRTPKKMNEITPMIGYDPLKQYLEKTEDTIRKMVLSPTCKPFLYGTFFMNQTVSKVENTTHSGFDLVKYHGSGGPANALLSMVVPGLGRHRVTYGQQKGIGTAVLFYASLGASLGLYAYGVGAGNFNDFTKEMGNFFKFKSNEDFEALSNPKSRQAAYYSAYALAGVAAAIYVGDVLYTLIRGSINASRQSKYRKGTIGVFYEPTTKTPILQYNYKFK